MENVLVSFGEVVTAIKEGKRASRKGWNGKGMWIALGVGNSALESDKFWNPHTRQHAVALGGFSAVAPYIIFKAADDSVQMGWTPSQADVLAEDWIIDNHIPTF